jgi:hypothetical protein
VAGFLGGLAVLIIGVLMVIPPLRRRTFAFLRRITGRGTRTAQ